MRIGFLFLLSVALGIPAKTQFMIYDVPLDSIREFVEKDPVEYQQCAVRFFNGDTTLYGLGILSVYYGGAFTDDYSPYGERQLANEVARLAKAGDTGKAIETALEIIDQNPGHLEMYYELAEAYLAGGDTTNAQRCYDLFYGLAAIPYHSGSGVSMDSAIIVRSVRDEYILLSLMGYGRPAGQSLMTDESGIPYDVMEVKDEAGELKKIYFNIYQPYSLGLVKKFSDTELSEDKPETDEKKKKKRRKKKKKKSKRNN